VTAAIEAHDLRKVFWRKEAVRGFSLNVAEGAIFALLGPNGSGKTTAIKMLMNIIRPDRGRASVLGVESRRLGPRELAQIGYVSENQELPDWMTVRYFLDYCRPMYPTWDDVFCAQMLTRLDLPPDQKLKHLSRGMRVKVALLSSLAYRPRLLVLDEPFGGLDPLVRDEVVSGILELAQQERWTILISSHDIDEVERIADWVGVIDQGRIDFSERIESIQARFRRVEVTLREEAGLPGSLPVSWVQPEQAGRRVAFVESQYEEGPAEQRVDAAFPGSERIVVTPMSLRDIFVVLARQYRTAEASQ
jgi:ABC-2 type transport system ATP-binding protein